MNGTDRHHLFALRVENKSGVLVRVAGLFARRGFNIVSLAVAPSDDERFSRISIVVDAESAPLQQVRDQLDKLVNVVEITEIAPGAAAVAELLLVAVGAQDPAVREVLARHRATVLDETVLAEQRAVIVASLAADPLALDALEAALAPFGIVDLQRTGRIALTASV